MTSFKEVLTLLKKLWMFFSQKRKTQFILLSLLSIFASIAEIFSIGAVIPFLGVLSDPSYVYEHPYSSYLISFLSIGTPSELLIPFTAIFILGVIVSAATRILHVIFSTKLCYQTGLEVGAIIFKNTLLQPYKIHSQTNSSEIINGITRKVDFLTQNILVELTRLVHAIFFLMLILSGLLIINPGITLSVIASFGIAYFIIMYLIRKKLSSNSLIIAKNTTKVMKISQEALEGIKEIIIYGIQDIFLKDFSRTDHSLKKSQAENTILVNIPRYIIEALGMVFLAFCILYLLGDSNSLLGLIPILGAVALGAQRLIPVMQQGFQGWSFLMGGKDSLKDLINFLYIENLLVNNQEDEINFSESIELKNLSLKYDDSEDLILKNINLFIKQNQKVALVGSTGSGKTSLINIIMGLLEPEKGSIMIDGKDLNQQLISSWQKKIAHVPQNIFLIDGSFIENISLGFEKQTLNQSWLRETLEVVQLSDYIDSLPEGLNTLVGERGAKISGGQMQRIGLARALYRNPEVLILDEATSALDANTEEKIMKSLISRENLTIILITHHMKNVKNYENIFLIENGTISDSGSYKDLIENNSNFKQLISEEIKT